jgi:hypothetical protein
MSATSAQSGALAGGETITITGQQLSAVTAVLIGGAAASGLTHVDNSSITVVIPHSQGYSAGAVPVQYEVSGGAPQDTDLVYNYEVLTAVDRQLEYAFAHWNDYNLDQYGDFTTWGGDCMNFVSQTLVARGWTVTEDWFNDAQEDWADAFVYLPTFDEWMTEHPEIGGVRLPGTATDQVKIGDIVIFDWDGDGSLDHAQVISGIENVDGVITIEMVGHDRDSDYRTIEQALAEQGLAGATVAFWSLPA